MDVLQVGRGLWRWTALHPDWTPEEGGGEGWGQTVGCVYYEAADAVVLIDPLVPPEDPERFWPALDRDIERAGRPVHILLTLFYHGRSANELAERYGAEIWGHEQTLKEERREVEPTRTFDFGSTLPGGIQPYHAVRFTEAVLWIPEHRALVFGDVVLGREGGGVRLCPESWLREGVGHADLKEALRPLLELPIAHVLVSHGEPVLENGHAALERALSDS